MRNCLLLLTTTIVRLCLGTFAEPLAVTDSQVSTDTVLVAGQNTGRIYIESDTEPAVLRAAQDLAEDFARVTGRKPEIETQISSGIKLIIGTLGQSEIIDQLGAQGRLDTNGISGHWESYILQVVTNPVAGVSRALVIAGSDRRGTIYGIYQLSELIGVSPWYWWADVPVAQKKTIALRGELLKQGSPGVKYRGIFINDEDWGLHPWAAKTFDPAFGDIGPKTYAKVFELMLRLRLNYLWPAMHECSRAFGSEPENAALAHQYGIVMGASHCEPMLYNNANWNQQTHGRWNYTLNRDTIHGIWEETAQARGQYEAVWTLGIRGVHDRGMERPPDDMPGKINLMSEIFRDQRELINQHVTAKWGPVGQCFVPYKEVLPIYDSGLKVPDDVTLMWVDDNFGYIRRLSAPAERKRSGGSGIYWHLSYYGGPHSYLWINTTAPALMWSELHKAWENDARTMWVINVGDIKPLEIGMDYFAKLAWNPDGFRLGAQRQFLQDFAAEHLGKDVARATADLLMDFYRLGTVRKPELMERRWALALTPERAAQLERDYQELLDRERSLSRKIAAPTQDAYTEMVGFPARVLGSVGLIFMADRDIQLTNHVVANENKIIKLRKQLEVEVDNFNTKVAGGKWNRMMPGVVTAKTLTAWNSQVRWPWGEPTNRPAPPRPQPADGNWRDAATAKRQPAANTARWVSIEGLGPSGRAMALKPASPDSSWTESDTKAPALAFEFKSKGGPAEAFIDFLPTFRIYPGMKLRIAVSVDGGAPRLIELPGSSGAQDENGDIRSNGVQNNFTRARIPLPELAAGKHTFVIRAVDPGAVIDRVWLP